MHGGRAVANNLIIKVFCTSKILCTLTRRLLVRLDAHHPSALLDLGLLHALLLGGRETGPSGRAVVIAVGGIGNGVAAHLEDVGALHGVGNTKHTSWSKMRAGVQLVVRLTVPERVRWLVLLIAGERHPIFNLVGVEDWLA